MKTSLSVLVPVYNEEYLVYESLRRLKILETSPQLERIEVIVVDDCSTDSSPHVIERFKKETERAQSNIRWIFLRHDHNRGKGQAVKTALELATCEICVIHGAIWSTTQKTFCVSSRFLSKNRQMLFMVRDLPVASRVESSCIGTSWATDYSHSSRIW